MNYRMKEVLLIVSAWVIFLVIPYIISKFGLDYKTMLSNSWWIYAGLVIGTVFYFLFPDDIRSIFCQICKKKLKDVLGRDLGNNDEDIRKLKEEVKNNSLIFPDNSARNITPKIKDPFLENLSEDFSSGKYEKIVLDASKKVEEDSVKGNIKEFKCRTFMEFAYSCMNLNQYDMVERVENLKFLINSKYNKYEGLGIKFLLSLSQCYLIQGNIEQALNTSYEALYKTQNCKCTHDAALLATIYHIQTRIFIAADKPIQAVAAAEEGMKYADDKMDSLLNYLLSSIYFNYFRNPYKAKIYADRSWSKIYKGADYYDSLVYLYYFSSFFAEDYQSATDFLENNINTEHNTQHYGNLSYLLLKVGRKTEAKKIAEEEIEKNNDTNKKSSAKNTLAMILKEEKNYEKAIYLFSDILPSFEKDKDNFWGRYFYAEILYNRGVCYAKLKNYEKANEDISKAIELNFDKVDIRLYEEIQYNLRKSKIEEKMIEHG